MYPQVLEIFHIGIDWIMSVLKIPINLGQGFTITIWQVNVFVVLMVLMIKFIRQDNGGFGGDRAEKYSQKIQTKGGSDHVRLNATNRKY